jgi:gamma-glutamylcyclotransferase (GGCT)/AIG2-like uncharacterized protein YtfP
VERLFVYGTLRRSYWNHRYIAHCRFIGKGLTKEKYAMFCNGIPFVCKEPKVSRIVGELYEVDEKTLQAIDRLEGHPDWYIRELTQVEVDGKTYTAWLYFCPEAKGVLIESGDYRDCKNF